MRCVLCDEVLSLNDLKYRDKQTGAHLDQCSTCRDILFDLRAEYKDYFTYDLDKVLQGD